MIDESGTGTAVIAAVILVETANARITRNTGGKNGT
jgi:hypothetical protein